MTLVNLKMKHRPSPVNLKMKHRPSQKAFVAGLNIPPTATAISWERLELPVIEPWTLHHSLSVYTFIPQYIPQRPLFLACAGLRHEIFPE